MNAKYQALLDAIKPAEINRRDDCTIVSAAGGCAFVTDPEQPHLGGNLEGGDPGTSYPHTLWPWLLGYYRPLTFLDVGCGEGGAAEWFALRGVFSIGVDGLDRNVSVARTKRICCHQHDFTIGRWPLSFAVDLVWCCDMLEHVEEQYLGNVFAALRLGKVAVVAHGTEGHGGTGWHHVTNKSDDWWIAKFKDEGFVLDQEQSIRSRLVALHGWYPLSGKVFLNNKVFLNDTRSI